jgi:DNA-binding response OmpR family regulator
MALGQRKRLTGSPPPRAPESDVETRSIDAHIRRLRVKLGPARDHIQTVVGLGYRFVK